MEEPVLRAIKHNCDVSDARFWGYFSVCGLLLRYRELFLSEQQLDPWSPVDREEIGRWISAKESQWPELERDGFHDLPFNGKSCDPFDAEEINALLLPRGYVYGAGFGMFQKPTFFLAEIRSAQVISGHQVYHSGRELVRDLFSAPAMLQHETILLRDAPLRAMLWDRMLQIRPAVATPLSEAFLVFGIRPGQPPDSEFVSALDRVACAYQTVLLWHELAESAQSLPAWRILLASVNHRGAEQYLRAVQDLLADTADNGPLAHCADLRDTSVLLLYAGLLDGYRRLLFPEIREILRFLGRNDWSGMEQMRDRAYRRLKELRSRILDLNNEGEPQKLLQGILELSRQATGTHAPSSPEKTSLPGDGQSGEG